MRQVSDGVRLMGMEQVCKAVVNLGVMMQEYSRVWTCSVAQALVCRSVGLRQACTHAQLVCSKAYSKTGGTEHKQGSMIGGSSKVMQAWQEPSVRLS